MVLTSFCHALWLPIGSEVKNLPAMQETQEAQGQSLGQEGPLKEGMAIHSSILAQRLLWTEEPGRIQSIGTQLDTTEAAEHACMRGYVILLKAVPCPLPSCFKTNINPTWVSFKRAWQLQDPFPTSCPTYLFHLAVSE